MKQGTGLHTHGLILGLVAFTIPIRATADLTILLEGTDCSRDMRFSLNSGIGATFHQAFNKSIYDLDEGNHQKGGHPP